MFRAEKLRMGSSAAREAELSMMKTRMRLVKMWWLISLWHPTRILKRKQIQYKLLFLYFLMLLYLVGFYCIVITQSKYKAQ
jgi:hypothetical protein